jgi:RNA polymerase sigma-70 factor (TIGR02957 family)
MSAADADGFDELRRVAFSIAYRMLGTVTEAEDVVQEALLRVHRELSAGTRLESPQGYVATVATRLAIDELRSARVRRERYVGDWLPEPLIGDAAGDPAQHAEIADSLSLAFLVLLESLSPEQRAVLLLRDVFGYGYDEIAAIVGKSVDNTRQLAARARRHVEERRPRFEASREQRDELARRFFAAAEEGDLEALEALLAHDVTLQGDGGGKAPALARTVVGSDRVARVLAANLPLISQVDAWLERLELNGQPGAILRDRDGRVFAAMVLDVLDGQISAVRSVVNPDKLGHLGPIGDAWATSRELLQARRSVTDS